MKVSEPVAPIGTAQGAVRDSIFGGLAREHGFAPLRIEGRLPATLRGTLWRNGPSTFDAGRAPHWFDGGGAVSAVRFDGATAMGAVRRVHTPSLDHDAGRERNRYAGFLQRMSAAQRVRAFLGRPAARNTASINVLPWQGRLFALMETVPPVEIDSADLRSLGETDLGGVVPRAFNAHPHYVPARRTTYQFGVRLGPKVFLDVFALPDEGAPRRLVSLPLPGVMEVHDFFATENHLVFVLPPLACHPLRMLWDGSFAGALRWNADGATQVWIVPIDAPGNVVRLETGPFYFWHGANAYESAGSGGTRIVVDVVRYPDYATALDYTKRVPAGGVVARHGGRLFRGDIDVRTGRSSWQPLADLDCEFPGVNPRALARRHRTVWMAGVRPSPTGEQGWHDHLVRVDTQTGETARYETGSRAVVTDPAIVPRSEREDDVWLLSLVRDLDAGASCVAIWDGERPGDPPVARAWFDQLLPPPLHGCWVAAN